MTFDQEIKQKRIYDVDRKEFNLIRHFTLFNQSVYHFKAYNVLLLFIAVILLITLGEKFKNSAKPLSVIALLLLGFIAIKLEHWMMFYQVDFIRSKISKEMNLFGHHFVLLEKDIKDIEGFYKLEYEMAYFITFRNSKNKFFIQYSKKNERQEQVVLLYRLVPRLPEQVWGFTRQQIMLASVNLEEMF